jgi:hypothetical protein
LFLISKISVAADCLPVAVQSGASTLHQSDVWQWFLLLCTFCSVYCLCVNVYCTTATMCQHCSVLYCTLLYCIVLYCTALHCTALYCTVLYYTVL